MKQNKVKSLPYWVRIRKVGDHCHITGKYRGPAHVICELNIRQKFCKCLPIAVHNLDNYDAHLFFTEVFKQKMLNLTLSQKLMKITDEGIIKNNRSNWSLVAVS